MFIDNAHMQQVMWKKPTVDVWSKTIQLKKKNRTPLVSCHLDAFIIYVGWVLNRGMGM